MLVPIAASFLVEVYLDIGAEGYISWLGGPMSLVVYDSSVVRCQNGKKPPPAAVAAVGGFLKIDATWVTSLRTRS